MSHARAATHDRIDRRSGVTASRIARSLALFGAIGILSGCAGEPSTAGTEAPLTIRHATESGNNQAGMTGRALDKPLRVVVTRQGRPAAGVEVFWTTEYGTVVGNGPSDQHGIATATWTLPSRIGGARWAWAYLQDRLDEGVAFDVNASHPDIEIVAGSGQHGVVGTVVDSDLLARVTWRGTPIVGEPVEWVGGQVAGDAVSDANGFVRGTWRLGTRAGQASVALRLRRLGANGPSASFHGSAGPGPATRVEPWGTTTRFWTRGRAGEVVVGGRVTDAFGNEVPDATISWSISAAGGVTIGPVAVASDALGVSRGVLHINGVSAGQDFTVLAALQGGNQFGTAVRVADFVAVNGPWGDNWETSTVSVPAGTTVQWATRTSRSHPLRFVTLDEAWNATIIGTVGSVEPHQTAMLQYRFDTPGTYVIGCESHMYWEEWLTVVVTP